MSPARQHRAVTAVDPIAATDDRLHGLRVGLDMDGVLADFNTGWMERYNREFGTSLEASMVDHWDGPRHLTHFASMDEFWAWARGEGASTFRHAPPLPGAVEAARRIAARHRLVIVSSKFEWAIPDSLAWLAEHGVPAREVQFLWDKTLARCDVYLDDAPHQLVHLAACLPEAVVCRMVHPWNAPLAGVHDIYTWAEFEALLERVAQERTAQEPRRERATSRAGDRRSDAAAPSLDGG